MEGSYIKIGDMSNTQTCACGSGQTLAQCCLPFIQGKKKAQTAEQLLRARYTAFTTGDIDFIMETHHSETLEQVKKKEIEEWSKNSKWLGFEVLEHEAGAAKDEQGTVSFHCRYESDGKEHDHYELSLFQKEKGDWKFVDARNLKPEPYRRETPKVGRNDACPCGSGKKYKKCHALSEAAAT
jgi:SEC-C motif domain protein